MRRLLDLPHGEAVDRLRGGAVAWVTVNPIEYHGRHLPLHTDRLQAEGWIEDLHRRLGEPGEPLLAKLDGPWEGEFKDGDLAFPLVVEFDWQQKDGLLYGKVLVTLSGEPESLWAVRRWDSHADEVYLDLTDAADITRGMDLDGPVSAGSFEGTSDISFPCPEGTCGFSGKFTLEPGGPGVVTETTPTTTPTGGD